ncbi:MAG: helix-turn-helix domain-containing protein [Eubacteriaceae bacterium]|nr:helix-turn-helix domain-containing protein [Eubacteriaceae bacterium]
MPVKKPTINHKHLSYDDRKTIETSIENRRTKADIARILNKDLSTIGKEVMKHRILKPRNTFNSPSVCANRKKCRKGCAGVKCGDFVEQGCKFRDRLPGACNNCGGKKRRIDKYIYDAKKAQAAYGKTLSGSREGFNLSEEERKEIGEKTAPLLKQGQPGCQIMSSHKRGIPASQRSLYTYIEPSLFEDFGLFSFSLKEKAGRRPRKTLKKRNGPKHFEGRRHKGCLQFCEENPDVPATGMDTVYNSPSGPYLQTLQFCGTGLVAGFLHEARTSKSMAATMDLLQERLGNGLWQRALQQNRIPAVHRPRKRI